MAKAIVGRSGSAFGAGGGRWIVGVLAVAGTLVMACALSPGLRADLDGLGIVAASLGGTYAAVVKDVVLSFAILSLPAIGMRASDAGLGGAREKHEWPLPAPKPRGKADVLKHDRHDEGRTP